jgi:hypothetical protein
LNFSLDVNLYTGYYRHKVYNLHDSKNDFGVFAEVYLKNKTQLAEFKNSTLYFTFEGGFDPYRWSQRKIFGHYVATNASYEKDGKNSYSLYAFPALQLDYRPTESIAISTILGAELRNLILVL